MVGLTHLRRSGSVPRPSGSARRNSTRQRPCLCQAQADGVPGRSLAHKGEHAYKQMSCAKAAASVSKCRGCAAEERCGVTNSPCRPAPCRLGRTGVCLCIKRSAAASRSRDADTLQLSAGRTKAKVARKLAIQVGRGVRAGQPDGCLRAGAAACRADLCRATRALCDLGRACAVWLCRCFSVKSTWPNLQAFRLHRPQRRY